jgi:peptidyl-tRNA hydrolase
MIKAYYIIREDLNMSPAKLAVQVGHGTSMLWSVFMMNGGNVFVKWIQDFSERKIVLKIATKEKLENLMSSMKDSNLVYFPIHDAGYTEFDGVTLTGVVIYPTNDEFVPKNVKRLRLWN